MLRSSLLLALGLSPLVACGGSVVTQAENGNAGAGGRSGAGAPPAGGYAGHVIGFAGFSGLGYGGVVDRPVPYCDEPVTDSVNGLVSCLSGFRHRPTAVICQPPPDLGAAGSAGEAGAGPQDPSAPCASDAECRHLPLGFCASGDGERPPYCASGCLQDSDCESRAICVCDGSNTGGKCVASNCKTAAECGPNAFCASVGDVCGGTSFKCTTQNDECYGGRDCAKGTCYDLGDRR